MIRLVGGARNLPTPRCRLLSPETLAQGSLQPQASAQNVFADPGVRTADCYSRPAFSDSATHGNDETVGLGVQPPRDYQRSLILTTPPLLVSRGGPADAVLLSHNNSTPSGKRNWRT